MGYSSWSNDFYADREAERKRTGKDAFVYHAAVTSGRAKREVHAAMNPKGVTRESRDSEDHPESVAIAVMLDVTGSMAGTPKTMQQSLPELMDQVKAAGVEHPQILFGAIGDFYSDAAPAQVGQFESGIEMDDDLGRIYMEGRGGGSNEESYQNILYFMARHTSMDCHEKRGKKGYLFLVGDESPYPSATKAEVKALFGDDIQDDIPTEQLVKEAQEKFEVYFVIPDGTYNAGARWLLNRWGGLLGEDHILTCDPTQICPTITSAIANPGQAPTVTAEAARTVRL